MRLQGGKLRAESTSGHNHTKRSLLKQVTWDHTQMGFEYLNHGDSTDSLGKLFQSSTTLTEKNNFLSLNVISCISIWVYYLLSCNWTPQVLALISPLSSPTRLLLLPDIYTHWFPQKLLFSRLCNSSSQPLFIWQIFQSLDHHCDLQKDSFQYTHTLVYWGAQYWTQYFKGVSPVLSRSEVSPPSSCWKCWQFLMQPMISLACFATRVPCWLMVRLLFTQTPKVTFCKIAFWLVLMTGVIPPLVKDSAFTSTELSKVTAAHFPRLLRSLNESTDIWCISLSSLFYTICRAAEGVHHTGQ